MAYNKGTSVCGRVRRAQDAIYETSEKSSDRLGSSIEQQTANSTTNKSTRESLRENHSNGVKHKSAANNSNNKQDSPMQGRPQSKLNSIESCGTFIRVSSQESKSSSRKYNNEVISSSKLSNNLSRKELRSSSEKEELVNNNGMVGHQSSSTDRSNLTNNGKVRAKKTTRELSNEKAMLNQQSNHNHIHHHGNQHRHHAPSCVASKLVNSSSIAATAAEDILVSPTRFKQHQPHCIHHNSHCQLKQQLFSRPTNLEELNSASLAQDINISNSSNGNNISDNNANKYKPVKYLKQQTDNNNNKSYLLVKYRSSQPASSYNNRGHQRNNGRHHQEDPSSLLHNSSSNGNNNNNNKRTTIKFISQLYFLLHLSAILSLLLHHKNLVASDRKPSQRWSSTIGGEFHSFTIFFYY